MLKIKKVVISATSLNYGSRYHSHQQEDRRRSSEQSNNRRQRRVDALRSDGGIGARKFTHFRTYVVVLRRIVVVAFQQEVFHVLGHEVTASASSFNNRVMAVIRRNKVVVLYSRIYIARICFPFQIEFKENEQGHFEEQYIPQKGCGVYMNIEGNRVQYVPFCLT